MGQNLALNIAEKGFPISVYNRTTSKVDETVERAKLEDSQQDYDSSVLLNDHFDSPLGSPGTSDVLVGTQNKSLFFNCYSFWPDGNNCFIFFCAASIRELLKLITDSG
ncbi:hypothetical protein CsatA_013972 [Cannabis sativa]